MEETSNEEANLNSIPPLDENNKVNNNANDASNENNNDSAQNDRDNNQDPPTQNDILQETNKDPSASTVPSVPIQPNSARFSKQSPRHFYSSIPQTARPGNSCRFIKTRPGTSRKMPYTSRKISSFATPVVELRTVYQIMDSQVHNFVANCNIEAISPELMMVYKRVDKAYDSFCTQANGVLSSQDPNATPRPQLSTSAISRISEELVSEWVTFIKLLNNTTSKGSTPFFQIISGRLSRILSIFRALNDRVKIGMINLALTWDGMRRVDGELILLRRECNRKYRDEAKIDEEFANKVRKMIKKVENIFRGASIKATMYTAEVMKIKSELQIEVSDLNTNLRAMVDFEESAGKTRAAIASVNDVFNSLFKELRLPFELKLRYEDDMTEKEKQEIRQDEADEQKREANALKPLVSNDKSGKMKVCTFENMV